LNVGAPTKSIGARLGAGISFGPNGALEDNFLQPP
jgi:hypothetical protein